MFLMMFFGIDIVYVLGCFVFFDEGFGLVIMWLIFRMFYVGILYGLINYGFDFIIWLGEMGL